jgi:hypothetical protein
MPLVKGKEASSKKGFSENVRREMHANKPHEQAVAIAYSEARKGKKMAHKKKEHMKEEHHKKEHHHEKHHSDMAMKNKMATTKHKSK